MCKRFSFKKSDVRNNAQNSCSNVRQTKLLPIANFLRNISITLSRRDKISIILIWLMPDDFETKLAQQVERQTGIPKVRVQIPLESTFFS